MDARALIDGLRRARRPDADDLRAFAAGLADGRVSDAQAGAFAMAVCLQGLGRAGRIALTEGMRDSGARLAWDLPGPVVDKHSTGGVGDAVSLILAPMLAACGAYVPMISGRGLGHTGGTLDKLEAIPGLRTDLDAEDLRRITAEVGCAIVGATPDLAPADRRLYAIRDVTGTVASLDLITASILSKKLAAGTGALVLDVKVGSGAFMKTMAEATDLAQSLVSTARGAGCPTTALITDMSQPLLPALGNALEVAEAVSILRGDAAGPLAEVAVALGAEVLQLAGCDPTETAATLRLTRALQSGAAAETFGRMVAAQGGPTDFVARMSRYLPTAPVTRPVPAAKGGTIHAIDGEALGRAVVALGGGRLREGDAIDPSVGLSAVLPLGTHVAKGNPLAMVRAADEARADAAVATVQAAVETGGRAHPPDLVLRRIS
ncbi:MAG: thymidine phosphorylase [Shimia sp.]